MIDGANGGHTGQSELLLDTVFSLYSFHVKYKKRSWPSTRLDTVLPASGTSSGMRGVSQV